jgi:hypothetical protein
MLLTTHEFHEGAALNVNQVFMVTAFYIQILPVRQCVIPDDVDAVYLPQCRYRPDLAVIKELPQAVLTDQRETPFTTCCGETRASRALSRLVREWGW